MVGVNSGASAMIAPEFRQKRGLRAHDRALAENNSCHLCSASRLPYVLPYSDERRRMRRSARWRQRRRKLNPDGYVHARDAERISAPARSGADVAARDRGGARRVGLKPGMSCLDVGSGPGAVMRLMADRVGPQGRVTGIEIDAKLGAQALADLRAARRRQVRADRSRRARARHGAGRAVRPHLLPALPHAYAGPGGGAGEDVVLDQAGRRGGGAGVRFRRHRGRAALPRHGRVQSPVRGRVQRRMAGTCGQGANCRRSSRRRASALPDGTLAEAKFLPLKDMAAMLIGVYQGLFAVGRRTRHRRPGPRRAVQGRHGRGRRGWALLLPHPHSDRRLEAAWRDRTVADAAVIPLLLAGHRVASYITAEPRRMSWRASPNVGDRRHASRCDCRVPLMGPGRSARKRGL